jgi:hypothetical protein
MGVTQLAIFLENKAGRLAEVTRVLGDAGVNIRGFSVADTAEYGILRLIVDNPQRAREALKVKEFAVHTSEVLCARVPDRPGGLASALEALGKRQINVEYMYPIGIALIVFGVERLEDAMDALKCTDTAVLHDEDIRRL